MIKWYWLLAIMYIEAIVLICIFAMIELKLKKKFDKNWECYA